MKIFLLKRLFHFLVLISSLLLFSCGFMSDSPPQNLDVYRIPEIQSCKLDATKLSDIFKTDQEEQIRCLQINFNQFLKYVPTVDPNAISEVELIIFIKKFFPNQSDSIIKGLNILFQLNMITLKDDITRISLRKIPSLFNILVKLNKEAVLINQVLKEMDAEESHRNFWDLREKLNVSVSLFSEEILSLMNGVTGTDQKINVKDFILDATENLGTEETKPETVDSLIFIKKLLVDGQKDILTSEELKLVIAKLPLLVATGFDLYYAKRSDFASDADSTRFYLTNVRNIYSVFKFEQNNFEMFTTEQLLYMTEAIGVKKHVRDYKTSIESIKSKVIGGNTALFTLNDGKVILDMASDLMERAYFSAVTYNAFQDIMEKNDPILHLGQLDLPNQYDLFSLARITELHKDFEAKAINIRYYANEGEGIPYYGKEIHRSRYGFIQSTLITLLSEKLLNSYGHKNSEGQAQVTVAEFESFLNDMKPVLKEFRMWSPKPTFAQNAVMLADLFQNKSGGDMEVGLTEATEYIQMIVAASKISDKFNTELTLLCDSGLNQADPVFEPACFNEHFFETLLNTIDYKKFYPSLTNYITSSPQTEVDAYITGVEGYARDNPDPKVAITKRDSILIFGAMTNIESTFLRFDTDGDNIIDYKELTKAFDVYRKTLVTMAKLKPKQEVYATSIFLYMISHLKLPPTESLKDNLRFFAFHKCVSNDFCRSHFLTKIEAKRLNIAKLLFYLANPNPQPFNADKIDDIANSQE